MNKWLIFFAACIAASVALLPAQAVAQQRSIINQGFEDFAPGYMPGAQRTNTPPALIEGWESVAASNGSPNFIEYWSDGFLSQPSRSGDYFVELNPSTPVFLYQEVCLIQNEMLSWGFWHAGRSGGPNPQVVEYTVRDSSNNLVQLLDTSSVPPDRSWNQTTGSGVFTGATGVYRVGFQSTNAGSLGNFLDDISVLPIGLLEFDGTPGSGIETNGDGIPVVLVSGSVTEDTLVTVSIDASSTATPGTDYTLNSTTILIPAGVYDGSSAGSQFQLPFTINDDIEIESNEVINVNLVSVTSAATGATSMTLQVGDIQCAGAPELTATYTIIDDDVAPIANDDSSTGNPGGADVSLGITGNDTDDGSIDATRVSLVVPAGALNIQTDANGDIIGFDVPGQGTWSVDPVSGVATFEPESGFFGNPTPVDYTVLDDSGIESNVATITIEYDPLPTGNFSTNEIAGNACVDSGGVLAGPNLFTAFDNGSFGTAPDATPQLSPTTNPYPGAALTGAIYDEYPDVGFGDFTIVSNIQTARNTFQVDGGVFDPVNGVFGRFLHIDPENFTQFPPNSFTGVAGNQYEVSFWAADAEKNAGQLSRIDVLVDGVSAFNTGVIKNPTTTQAAWVKYSFLVTAAGASVDIQLQINDQSGNPISGGGGRDIHFDNVAIQACETTEISVVKSIDSVADSNSNGVVDQGDTITYEYVATNGGNVTLFDIALTETASAFTGTGPDPLPSYDSGGSNEDGQADALDITPGSSIRFTATYVITGDDVVAGDISNSAIASGTSPAGTAVEDTSDAGTEPGLDSNDDPVDVSNPETDDTDSDPSTPIDEDPTILNLPSPDPSISIVKSITGFSDLDGSLTLNAGDEVEFSFTAENTGTTALANISITDAGLTPITVTPDGGFDGNLAVGEGPVDVATATYVLTVGDIASGEIENSATGAGSPVATLPSGQPDVATPLLNAFGDPLDPVTDVSDAGTEPEVDPTTGNPETVGTPETEETVTADGTTDGDPTNDPTSLLIPAPSMTVQKSVASYVDTNTNGIVDAGDTVNYSFRVENTGDVDLSNVVVTDSLEPTAVVSGSPIASLAVGAVDSTVTATYVLQTADIAAGGVENTATATGTAVDDNGNPIGDPFNPGSPLTTSDDSDAGTDPDGNPLPNPEVVETPDIDDMTDGDPTNDPTVFQITPSPSIELIKSVSSIVDNGDGVLGAGDEVIFSFVATNTGNVDLAGVTVTDTGLSAVVLTPAGGFTGDLDIGDTDVVVASASYILTATDVAAGGIENTATASGTAVDSAGDPILDPITGDPLVATDDSDSGSEQLLDSSGNPVPQTDPELTDGPDLAGNTDGDPTNDPTVLFIPNPSLTVIKSVATVLDDNPLVGGGFGDGLFGGDGDTINYVFTVTNTGNVDLQGITLVDSLPGIVSMGGPLDLDVGMGDSITFTASYTVLSTDTARGYIENRATASGDAADSSGNPIYGPTGTPLTATGTSDAGTDPATDPISDPLNNETPDGMGLTDGDPSNDPTVVSVPGNPTPRLSVIKSVTSVVDTTADGAIGEGDTVTFSFAVTNTGNVALAGVDVTDMTATMSGGPIANLAIGATDTTTFTATHVITALEDASGAVENSAQAIGGAVNSAGDPLLDPATGSQRTATDTSDAGTDPDIGTTGTPTPYTDPLGNETPDADGNTDTDPTNDPTVLFLPMPEMQVVKSVTSVADTNGNGFTDAGDTVSYAFAVTNTGNTDLVNISITDMLAGVVVSGNPIATLDQGDTDTSITATYVLQPTDIENGSVENTAEGSGTAVDDNGDPLGDPTSPGNPLIVTDTSDAGTDPDGDPVSDPEGEETPTPNTPPNGDPTDDPTTFSITPAPALELIKVVDSINDVDGNGLPGVGDIITYAFTVSNVGNVDLTGVTISDFIGTVNGGPIDLDIGATDTSTFTMDYVIDADDVADGFKENTATATGTATDSDGNVITDPITGNPLTTIDDSDAGTGPELDGSGDPETVADPETTETPDGTGNTDGDPANDPTVLGLPNPELTVVKSVASILDDNVPGGDGLFGGEGDTVNYAFTITNTGNVDLIGITLTDSLAPVTGGPINLAVGVGDSTTFTASYTVSNTDVARGYLENTASATGSAVNADGDPLLDLNGNPITTTDTSDAGTNPDGTDVSDPEGEETPGVTGSTPPDGDPTNDPTVTTIPANPVPGITIIKSVASVTDNGDGMLGAGDTVTFSFEVTNTGNLILGNVMITDGLAMVSGGPITLAVGATDDTSFTATHVITADEAEAGAVENTAEVSGAAINSSGDPITDPATGDQLTATDTSDAGTEPEFGSSGTPQDIASPEANETPDADGNTDGDPANDPTVLFIPNPSMTVTKSIATLPDTNNDGLFGGPGDVITYAFRVENTGNVTLDNVVVSDDTAVVSGGPLTLAPGQVDGSSITATYTVTAADIATGFVENTATGFGDALGSDGNPLGNPVDPGTPITVTDTSDTGTDPSGDPVSDPETSEVPGPAGSTPTDGDPTNDPTVTFVPANPDPEISLIKSVAAAFDTDGDAVVGGEDDEILYQFDVTNTGNVDLADVEVNDPMLGGVIGAIASLPIGATESFTVLYVITEADQLAGQVENTATATGTAVNVNGDPIIDLTTGDPYTADDTSDSGTDTSANPIGDPESTETPSIGGPDGDPTNDPTLLTIPLAVPDTGVSGTVFLDANQDDILDGGDTGLPSYIVRLVDENGDVIATTTTGPDGTYSMEGFPIGTHSLEFIDPVTGEVIGTREGLVFGRNTVLANQDQAVLPASSSDALIATKTTPLRNVVLGSVVPYTITIENPQAFPVTVDIVDQLPTGVIYLPDSGILDGAASEPTIAGNTLTWSGVTVGIGATVVVELSARVGPDAPIGNLPNTATAVDGGTGQDLSNTATATVRRNVETVFDCSHVIGKVFDDRNIDGYQNGPAPENRAAITDQDIFVNGKIGKPEAEPSYGEPGLPNVRLVTPTGTIITTDEYGRYSVPCAELPRDMGSNFTLKLDTRSLPTGYRVTTENPRTMRLTSGIMAEMNFGASIGRVADIDLTAASFESDGGPVTALENAVDRLLMQIASTPTLMRISYFGRGESNDLIDARLDALEDYIDDQWNRIGEYRLIIERDTKRLQ